LTHAAIYEADPRAGAVIHCHDSKLWPALLNRVPTTSKGVEYGTLEMAYEIMHLFRTSDVRNRRILAMAGHEGGIIAFGKNFDDASAVLMRDQEESYLS
jgi:L-ribulose-5-phosphate 4-epimerase